MTGIPGLSNPIARALLDSAYWVENLGRRRKGLKPLVGSGLIRGVGEPLHFSSPPRHPFPRINDYDKSMGFAPAEAQGNWSSPPAI